MLFRDRYDAGQRLAQKLQRYAHNPDVMVLALPRGGVPVAYEVAKALGAPFDLFLVRKLGLPGQPELAMGAVASGGGVVLNEELAARLEIPDRVIRAAVERERRELDRQQEQLRGRRPPSQIADRIVILIDDGLATGSTMRAAVAALRSQRPKRIVVAVPVGAAETCQQFRAEVDEFVCLLCPEDFYAVGAWYEDFNQTDDGEVISLLADMRAETSNRLEPSSFHSE